jgi:hypothetical protein
MGGDDRKLVVLDAEELPHGATDDVLRPDAEPLQVGPVEARDPQVAICQPDDAGKGARAIARRFIGSGQRGSIAPAFKLH